MKIISTAILLLFSNLAISQDLLKDSIFFYKQVKEYQTWLYKTEFFNVISFQEIEMKSDKIILDLSLTSDLEWFGLKKTYHGDNLNAIPELLFARMVHLFEIPQENAEIRLTDYKNYFVNISYQNNKLVVIEPNPKGLVKNDIIIPIIKINALQIGTTQDVIESNVDKVKYIIETYLHGLYKNKTARFSNATVKIWQDENTVYANISNITKEIIYDDFVGYWELIDIVIKIEQVDNKVKIDYTLQGKYGAGIFTAPRQNDFIDMERDYKSFLDSYNDQLKFNIRNELLKK